METQWISIKDRLPQKGEDVIVSDGRDKWIGSYRWHSETEGSWAVIMHGPFRSADVKLWMSFPEAPNTTLTKEQMRQQDDLSEQREEYD